ncbi:MAG: hypothetical protein WDN28_15190 [Chthoniobacter sp.]
MTAGVATLGNANTYTGATVVGSGGILNINHSQALANTASITVNSTGYAVIGAGLTISGKTITISGTGANNFGALQGAASSSTIWAGNIVVTSAGARIGGGDTGTLTISGVISGGNGAMGPILFSRANNSTTILNAVNTYTADTQLFANSGTGDTLKIGVDNAINAGSRLSVYAQTPATVAMTLDLNGHTPHAARSGYHHRRRPQTPLNRPPAMFSLWQITAPFPPSSPSAIRSRPIWRPLAES